MCTYTSNNVLRHKRVKKTFITVIKLKHLKYRQLGTQILKKYFTL